MHLNRKLRTVAASAALVLALGIIPMVPASADLSASLPSGGTLTLHLNGPTSRFEHSSLGSEGVYVSGCTVIVGGQTGDTDLVDVSTRVPGKSGTPYASDGKIGILTSGGATVGIGAAQTKGTGASGTACGQVNPGESLTLSLGSALDGSIVSEADLDIDGKYGVTVVATLFLNGVQVGDPILRLSPPAADSGSDSGANDNFRFEITGKYFDTIVLTGQQGPSGNTNYSFSLAGGGQSGVPTTFTLVKTDGLLDCDATDNTYSEGGNTTPEAAITGLACASPVPFELTTSVNEDGEVVALLMDLLGDSNAEFRLQITWTPETLAALPDQVRLIDYGGGPHPLQWCDGYASDPQLPETAVTTDPAGTLEQWCIYEQNIAVAGEDAQGSKLVQVVDTLFGTGDPIVKKG